MINENTKSGETVMIVGVGNTLGILQWEIQKERLQIVILAWNVIYAKTHQKENSNLMILSLKVVISVVNVMVTY